MHQITTRTLTIRPCGSWKMKRPSQGHHRSVDLVVMAAIGVYLSVAQQSLGLRLSHPMYEAVNNVNENGGPYFGLVMTYSTERNALVESGLFVPSSYVPWIDMAGRRFNVGKLKDVDVIYVMSGEQIVNAAMTTQILLDLFEIRGVVHYGVAGSINSTLHVGDVSVPKYVAFTSSWKWKEFMSEGENATELNVGAYNFPLKGENLLGRIQLTQTEFFRTGKPMEKIFWLPIDSKWFHVATQLQNLKLRQCLNETYCLPEPPKVVFGVKGSTADIFLANEAYGKFLLKKLNVSIVDEEDAAIVMTCLSNGVPAVVFRGISDTAGDSKLNETSLNAFLASVNALTVAVQFMESFNNSSIDST